MSSLTLHCQCASRGKAAEEQVLLYSRAMLAALAFSLSLLDTPPISRLAPAQPDAWSFDFSTYYWAASLSGEISIDGEEVDIEDGGDGGLSAPALLGFLGSFEAHHGPWSYVFAPIFISASDMKGGQPPNTDADVDIHAQVHELFVARELGDGWEWMAGARYQRLDTTMDLSIGGVPQSSHESTRTWTDPIVGLRYHSELGADWSLHARGDVGGLGLGSDFAWNASAVFDYKFTELFGMFLGYRALSFRWEDLGGSGRSAYDLSMFGPVIGASFSF